nr:serine/threonine-protein kinase D6PKL2-like [Tanacetum cinerariifolium]
MGASAIKHHSFFQGVNWALLRCTKPPFIPPPFNISSREVVSDDSCPDTPDMFLFQLMINKSLGSCNEALRAFGVVTPWPALPHRRSALPNGVGEAKVAEAICLRDETSKLEDAEKSFRDEVTASNERNTILEKERNALDVKVMGLQAVVVTKG